MTTDNAPDSVQHLSARSATGIYAIRSESATVYYLFLTAGASPVLGALLRVPGKGSSTMSGDDRWVPLTRIVRGDEQDGSREVITETPKLVTIGHRHRCELAPRHPNDAAWWIQRRATSITRLDRVPDGLPKP
jgi:hypothetical protein